MSKNSEKMALNYLSLEKPPLTRKWSLPRYFYNLSNAYVKNWGVNQPFVRYIRNEAKMVIFQSINFDINFETKKLNYL